MHVLYFHQHFSTPRGATGTRSYEMAKALLARGHRVTMVCGSSSMGHTGLSGTPVRGLRDGMVDGIHVIEICAPYSNYDSLFKRSMTFLRFAFRSIALATRTDYDLLFATSTPLTAGIPGIIMRLLKPRKPFVFEVRDLWPELPRAMKVVKNPLILMAMSVLEKITYSAAHGCIGLSPGIVRGIQKRSRKVPVAMIPNGADLELFGKPAVPDETTKLYELPDARLRAVFTGAHGMANGLDAVLDAAAVLKARGEEGISLIFVGDGKLKPGLVERARKEGLDSCIFIDPIPKDHLADFLRQTDVGLMILAPVPAFYYGTSPNKFFDYIATGLPVLNNYPGWLADLTHEHECGQAVPPNDPNALADALIALANEPGARQQMGVRARELAQTVFNRTSLANQFIDFLEAVHCRQADKYIKHHRPPTPTRLPRQGYSRNEALTDAMMGEIAELHSTGLDQAFLSKLGPRFLTLLYKTLRDSASAELIVAEKDGEVIGFIAGTLDTNQFFKEFIRRNFFRGGLILLFRLTSLRRIKHVFDLLLYPGKQDGRKALPKPELLSMAVHEDWRGTHVATELYQELVKRLQERDNVSAFKIVVGVNLERAHHFYTKMGAQQISRTTVHQDQESLIFVQQITEIDEETTS